jgi:hypothetical protein
MCLLLLHALLCCMLLDRVAHPHSQVGRISPVCGVADLPLPDDLIRSDSSARVTFMLPFPLSASMSCLLLTADTFLLL